MVGHEPGRKPGREQGLCGDHTIDHAAGAFLRVVEEEHRNGPDKGGEDAEQEHIAGRKDTAHIQAREPALEHLDEDREHHQFAIDADAQSH